MTSQSNLGNTSKNIYSFKSRYEVPKDFSGICQIGEVYNRYWFFNGKEHREDGPAIEWADGTKYWYLLGKRHRLDGPAVEYVDGTKEWWIDNQLHRINGPAIEYASGGKEWVIHGEYHRIDGPACEWANGDKEWYLNDQRYGENNDFTTQSWIHFQRTLLF
jgi:hypothetical protein